VNDGGKIAVGTIAAGFGLGSLNWSCRGWLTRRGWLRTRFDGIDARLDAIDARLERQGGWFRGGQTNLARLNDWSENVDKILPDLSKRLAKLEGGGAK
jgi:hypothetical protein